MSSQIDLLRSSLKKNDQLSCCRRRIEMKYLFSWLLQNNLLWCRNDVWNTKASANALAFLFQTTFHHLRGYSATNTKMRAFFSDILGTVNDCLVNTSYVTKCCVITFIYDKVLYKHRLCRVLWRRLSVSL